MNQGAPSRLAALVARCEGDITATLAARAEGDALATDVPGDLALRWHVLVLRAVMADPPDGDAVRELYGELVDRYRGEPAHIALLKPLGDEIRRRESEGSLPSVLVARSDRRKR